MTQWKWWSPRSNGPLEERDASSADEGRIAGIRLGRRQKWIAGAAAALLSLLALWFGLGPLIENRAVAAAAARGLTLEVGSVSPGWFGATLSDVVVRPVGVPGVQARLTTLSARVSLGLRPRELGAQQGIIEIEGSFEEVREQLETWRRTFRQKVDPEASTGSGGGPHYRAEGLDLVWRGAFSEGDEQRFRGLKFERTNAVQQLGLDHLRLEHPRGAVELAGLRALWQRGEGVERLTEASIAEARVKASWTVSSSEEIPAQGAIDQVDAADAQRRAGSTTPEEVGLSGRLPEVDADRGRRLQELLSRWIESASERLPEQSKVGALWLELERGDQHLHLGPSTLEVTRTDAALELALTPQGETKGTPLAVQARLPRGAGPRSLKIEGGPVSLATLGVREGDFGLVGVDQAEVGGLVDAELSADGSTLSLGGNVALGRMAVKNERLAPRPVSVERARLEGKAEVDVGGRRYAVPKVELTIGEASFELEGVLDRGEDYVAMKLRGGTPLIACQTLLDSAPRGLLDLVEQTRMKGTLALDVGVEFDSRKPSDIKVRWDLKNACRITEVPASLSPERFSHPWQHEVGGPDAMALVLETGPGTASWTSIDMMSPHLESAVLVCEDGRFFRHDGFDARAIEASIQLNVRAGRFVRGASTVSMQLAKNLYLSREKKLSRKLQEAVLTLLLEQRLSKRELLEIYFNVVELGPGVYGIRHAAEHYFATTPDQLTLAQSFFLVSILPSPTRQFFGTDGNLNSGRAAYVRQLLKIARDRNRITDAELEAGLAEELRFGVSHTRGDAEPAAQEELFFPGLELGPSGSATRTAAPPSSELAVP